MYQVRSDPRCSVSKCKTCGRVKEDHRPLTFVIESAVKGIAHVTLSLPLCNIHKEASYSSTSGIVSTKCKEEEEEEEEEGEAGEGAGA